MKIMDTAQYQHDTVGGGIRQGTGQLIGPNLESQTAKQPEAEPKAGSTLHGLCQHLAFCRKGHKLHKIRSKLPRRMGNPYLTRLRRAKERII